MYFFYTSDYREPRPQPRSAYLEQRPLEPLADSNKHFSGNFDKLLGAECGLGDSEPLLGSLVLRGPEAGGVSGGRC